MKRTWGRADIGPGTGRISTVGTLHRPIDRLGVPPWLATPATSGRGRAWRGLTRASRAYHATISLLEVGLALWRIVARYLEKRGASGAAT